MTDTAAESVTLTGGGHHGQRDRDPDSRASCSRPEVDASHSTRERQSDDVTVAARRPSPSPCGIRRANAQPVAGQTVTLAGTGSAVIGPAATPNVTNASGVVTFTATDPDAEVVTFTATDTTQSTVIAKRPR